MKESAIAEQKTLFGHPTGLYTLFFAEMWERFSYYGMRALLLLYMLKGFLGYGDKDANAVYGAYTALVYMTPFFGGMIADKLLGARASVIIGGLLMAAGHLLMTLEQDLPFFTALGLLIAGNGFFKPNISTIVGSLYPEGSPKRDSGFTIFYIGINLGAAMAPLLCGYVGETYGWHYGFGLATIGMLLGVAIFVAPTILTQILILLAAGVSAYGLLFFNAGDVFSVVSNIFVAVALVISAGAAFIALGKGGLPKDVGLPPNPSAFKGNLAKVLIGTFFVIPIFVVLVSGFSVIPGVGEQVTLLPHSVVEPLESSDSPILKGLAEFVNEASRPAGLVLILAGLGATIYLVREAFRMEKVARERMFVVFILTFFSLLFWAFFEQSGSSVNNFTDRNVDRVVETSKVTQAQVGTTVQLDLDVNASDSDGSDKAYYMSQEFLGHVNGSAVFKKQVDDAIRAVEGAKDESKQMDPADLDKLIKKVNDYPTVTMTTLNYLRANAKRDDATPADKKVEWTFVEENKGKIGLGGSEIPASVFQAVNPIYIMIFGLVFTFLWGWMGSRGFEPSTPVKFAFGLIQLGFGFAMLYFGAQTSVDGMVASYWLLLMYLLLTTGELCLSPVGLSMVTKLSPKRLVSTVMGSWFLATAFSQFLAAIIAQFANVSEGSDNFVPNPIDSVNIYGDVYQMIAIMAVASGVFCLLLSPILKKWMHMDVPHKDDE